MARVKKKQTPDERREMKKLSMRRAREKLKNDAQQYEIVKAIDKERKRKTRKKINEVSDREKRNLRKNWRERAKKYRQNKKVLLHAVESLTTPPESPNQNDMNIVNSVNRSEIPSTSRVDSGKRKRRKNTDLLKKEIKRLKEKNDKLEKSVSKYRTRFYREKNKNKDTPTKETDKLLEGQRVSHFVRKQLKFGAILKNQIRLNMKKHTKIAIKKNFVQMMTGQVIKKYKLKTYVASFTSKKLIHCRTELGSIKKNQRVKNDIRCFLEQDENSRMCAGKRETVTRHKKKMQKRFLNDTMRNLHIKFLSKCPQYLNKVSYAFFCRFRPYWIVPLDWRARETCLCELHANMNLVVQKLHSLKLVEEKTPNEIIKHMTCNGELNEKCLERKCPECSNLNVKFCEFTDESVQYQQWVTKSEIVNIKGHMKVCKKTKKEDILSSKRNLVSKFCILIDKFMIHVSNIRHQYYVVNKIKNSLTENDVLVHMDYSENYSCKYSEEIQSFHFGGSRKQITLHTVVTYFLKDGKLAHKSFCTLSECLRHDSVAVCTHLKPIANEMKILVPKLEKVHFLSDGPTGQYRNKNMFHLIPTVLAKDFEAKSIHWHYSEKGHGKGAADGVGGTVKRYADSLVSQGKDIPNINVLFSELKAKDSAIQFFLVNEDEIKETDKSLPQNLKAFKGTLKVHELTWSTTKRSELQARRLSCLQCKSNEICKHYGIGLIMIKIAVPESTGILKHKLVSLWYNLDNIDLLLQY